MHLVLLNISMQSNKISVEFAKDEESVIPQKILFDYVYEFNKYMESRSTHFCLSRGLINDGHDMGSFHLDNPIQSNFESNSVVLTIESPYYVNQNSIAS